MLIPKVTSLGSLKKMEYSGVFGGSCGAREGISDLHTSALLAVSIPEKEASLSHFNIKCQLSTIGNPKTQGVPRVLVGPAHVLARHRASNWFCGSRVHSFNCINPHTSAKTFPEATL